MCCGETPKDKMDGWMDGWKRLKRRDEEKDKAITDKRFGRCMLAGQMGRSFLPPDQTL